MTVRTEARTWLAWLFTPYLAYPFLGGRQWTVYCSLPGTPRDRYDLEIDVTAPTHLAAARGARAIIRARHDPALQPRLVLRWRREWVSRPVERDDPPPPG